MRQSVRRVGVIVVALILSIGRLAFAQNAMWSTTPGSGDWNTNSNWVPSIVPTGTATFATSSTTGVSTSATTAIGEIAFNSGASAFTITSSPAFNFSISGVGIANSSGTVQNFVAQTSVSSRGAIIFSNTATAGSNTTFTVQAAATNNDTTAGLLQFTGSSDAGSAAINNDGAFAPSSVG